MRLGLAWPRVALAPNEGCGALPASLPLRVMPLCTRRFAEQPAIIKNRKLSFSRAAKASGQGLARSIRKIDNSLPRGLRSGIVFQKGR
jgi:hypothetical protein